MRHLLALLVVLPLALVLSNTEPFRRLPVMCNWLTHRDVCTDDSQFTFSDGCNSMSCIREGIGGTTLRYCKSEDELGDAKATAICDRIRQDAAEARSAAGNKLKSSWGLPVTCNGLTHKDVCTDDSQFGFTDGCNILSCTGKGTGETTYRYCISEDELVDVRIMLTCGRIRQDVKEEKEASRDLTATGPY